MRGLLLALLLPIAAQAQTILTPGHPDLTAAAPQSAEYDMRFAGDTLHTVGRFASTETVSGDRLTIVTLDLLHFELPLFEQETRDTTVVTWPGLVPVSRSAARDDARGEEMYHVAAAGGRITGRLVVGNLDEALDAPLPAGVFLEGAAWRIARSVPLRDGYTATFQMADQRGDVSTGTVTVAGPDGDAWNVTVARPPKPPTTYTVDGATRRVLRTSFSPDATLTVEYVPLAARPAGPVLRPGDPALDLSWMRGQAPALAVRLLNTGSPPNEYGTRTSTRAVVDGVMTVTTTLTPSTHSLVQMVGKTVTTTSVADAATLAPISTVVRAGPSGSSVTYAPGHVAGTRTAALGDVPVSADLASPVFDATWAMEIAQSLPLTAGYTATIETYDAVYGLQTITYTVSGPEDVDGKAVWAVASATSAGPVAYRIDGATRQLVSMRTNPGPGTAVEVTPKP